MTDIPAFKKPSLPATHADAAAMAVVQRKEVFIQGLTVDGHIFRPSDWAERLCGVMSPYRPEGSGGSRAHLGYSPYVRPTVVDGVRCVVVDQRLRDIEPLAWEFVMSFARENNLQHFEACELRK